MRTLSPLALNRALLARQGLLERAPLPIPAALERIGGIQAQYAPSMYVGLWSRVRGLERAALTRVQIEELVGKDRARGVGLWIDMVRVPPSGTWERRRADLYAAAEDWLGPPPELAAAAAQEHLVRRYLAGFGPASAASFE